MRRLIWLLLLGTAFAQTPVTVTGTITDASGAVATSGYVQFDISPTNQGFFYTINGTATIAPQTTQCGINGSGALQNIGLTGACKIWGNDIILPANTLYTVTLAPGGQITNSINNVSITGSTASINSPVIIQVPLPSVSAFITANPLQTMTLVPAADLVYSIGQPNARYSTIWVSQINWENCGSSPGCGGSGVTGTGTLNTVPKWLTSSSIGNSSITDNGTTVATTEAFTAGSLTATGLIPGDCVQAGTGGLLTTTGSACGSGGGGVGGSGTGGFIPIWTGSGASSTLGNSNFQVNSTNGLQYFASSPGSSAQGGLIIIRGAAGTGTSSSSSCGSNMYLEGGAAQNGTTFGSIQIAGTCNPGVGGTTYQDAIELNPAAASSTTGGVVSIGLQSAGGSQLASVLSLDTTTFANLGSMNVAAFNQSNSIVFCYDCAKAAGSTCAGSSTGALAIYNERVNAWYCY